MEGDRPSSTAIASAIFRAMHIVLDPPPHVFEDVYAYPFVGPEADGYVERLRGVYGPELHARARASFALRHRLVEDELGGAIERGIVQYVIVGAGLDSFAWRRRDLLGSLRVFEVDHPNSQRWKRSRLAALGLDEPDGLVFVPVDLQRDGLMDALERAGFDKRLPTFVAMIGVTQYVARDALAVTLRAVASMAEGTTLFIGVHLDDTSADEATRSFNALARARAASVGEPWTTVYTVPEFETLAKACGFVRIRRVDEDEIAALFTGRPDGLRPLEYSYFVAQR